VGLAEVGTLQVGPAEVGTLQVEVRGILNKPRGICPGEAKSSEWAWTFGTTGSRLPCCKDVLEFFRTFEADVLPPNLARRATGIGIVRVFARHCVLPGHDLRLIGMLPG